MKPTPIVTNEMVEIAAKTQFGFAQQTLPNCPSWEDVLGKQKYLAEMRAILEAALSASPLEEAVRALEPFATALTDMDIERISQWQTPIDEARFSAEPLVKDYLFAREVYSRLTALRPPEQTTK